MNRRWKWLILAAAALLLGGLLYGIFRQDTFLGRAVGSVLPVAAVEPAAFGGLFAWYVPDFLWMFSLGSVLLAVTERKRGTAILCCMAAAAWGLLWELGQLAGWLPGTGDAWDVFLYIIAAAAVFMINNIMR